MFVKNENIGSKRANTAFACCVKLIGDSDTEV